MADWRIIEGDCRDVLRQMPAGSVHTVVTSPPYFGLRDYGTEGQIGLEPTPDEARTCECGCGRSLEERRANTKYATRECREFVAQERAEMALQARLARNRRKLDLRIAYGRIVSRYGESAARELLTERQRTALEERGSRT